MKKVEKRYNKHGKRQNMHPLRKIGRKTLRIVLKYLCLAVIKKHRPDIIAIMGTGPTGIIREAVYTLLHEDYPVRRNLESPESEFSVPLTILGSSTYPTNDLQWLPLLFMFFRQWLTTKPYFHILVLEMGTVNEESLTYWLEITRPKFIVISGESCLPKDVNPKKTTLIKCATVSLDDQNLYSEAVSILGKHYALPEDQIKDVSEKMTLPKSRISIRHGKHGQFILDSTYYYYPSPLKAVVEIAEALPEPRAYFLDENLIKKEGPEIKDTVFALHRESEFGKYKTIVVRGQRARMRPFLESL